MQYHEIQVPWWKKRFRLQDPRGEVTENMFEQMFEKSIDF